MWRDPEGVARDVLRHADRMPLLAVVDLHNNTGKNPHYAVLTDFSPGSLGLAARFGDTAVYIEEPATVLTRAFSPHTPNVALELGPVSDSGATSRGYNFLRGLLPLHRIPEAAQESVRLYRTLARVHLRQGARFAFASDVKDGSSSGACGEKSGADNAGARSSQQNGLTWYSMTPSKQATSPDCRREPYRNRGKRPGAASSGQSPQRGHRAVFRCPWRAHHPHRRRGSRDVYHQPERRAAGLPVLFHGAIGPE